MAAIAKLKPAFNNNPIFYLSHIDCIHDFKTFLGQDRPTQPRGGDPTKFHYWTGFKHYIMSFENKGTEVNSSDTKLFNGCRPVIPAVTIEDLGLELSVDLIKPTLIPIIYSGRTPNSFYTDIYTALSEYIGGDGRIPLVVDVEYKLNGATALREFVDRFAVCRNKENYADPGRSFSRDYGTAVVEESGDEERTYDIDDKLDTRLGAVTVSGTKGDVTINYGGVITEKYKQQGVMANTKGQCQGPFNKLLTMNDYTQKSIDYCSDFERNKNLPGSYGSPALLAQLAAHLIKKRLGDQLQVQSCKRTISYKTSAGASVQYGGEDVPCVFWSIDRVAIAYAIILGIPCVQEFVNGNIRLYIPKPQRGRDQIGGACTRANLEYTSTELRNGIPTTTPIVSLINTNYECLNRYIELHYETDSIYYEPINCIILIKFLVDNGHLPASRFIPAMFEETYLTLNDNPTPQLYIDGDTNAETEKAIIANLRDTPSWVFYTFKYKLYIDHAIGAGGEHMFQICNTKENGSTPGTVIATFNQRALEPATGVRVLLQEGGYGTRKKENPLLYFLSAMSSVEKKMVVLSDNRELFCAEIKGFDVPIVGYTCYDMIFFIKAIVKHLKDSDNKQLVSESIGALFDILKELGEDSLIKNIKLFLNTYSQYKHKHVSSTTHTDKHVKLIKSLIGKSKESAKRIQTAMGEFKYDSDKMVRYLNKHLPLGSLTKLYNKADKTLSSYKNVATVFNNGVSKLRSMSKQSKQSSGRTRRVSNSTSSRIKRNNTQRFRQQLHTLVE